MDGPGTRATGIMEDMSGNIHTADGIDSKDTDGSTTERESQLDQANQRVTSTNAVLSTNRLRKDIQLHWLRSVFQDAKSVKQSICGITMLVASSSEEKKYTRDMPLADTESLINGRESPDVLSLRSDSSQARVLTTTLENLPRAIIDSTTVKCSRSKSPVDGPGSSPLMVAATGSHT